MLSQLGSWVEELREWAGSVEPGTLDGDQAAALLGAASEGERLFAAVKLLAAARVADTGVWQRGGFRSPADWLAERTKSDRFRAVSAMESACRLGAFPVVAAELRGGRLSEAQAHLILDAAGSRPGAERHLVDFASGHTVRQLGDECRRLRTAEADSAGEAGRAHRERELKTWKGRDGSLRGSFKLTAEAGTLVLAHVEARVGELNRAARAEGRCEPFAALAADAFVELITEERGGAVKEAPSTRPQASVVVHVDYEALIRGAVEGDEVCEIQGVGPIPILVARRLLDDCVLYLLVKRGGAPDVTTPGVRSIPKGTRLKVEAQDQWQCAVPGCDQTKGLQIHHIRWHSRLGDRSKENLVLVCRRHHDMITYNGWELTGPPGARVFAPSAEWVPEPHPGPEVPLWTSPYAARPDGPGLAGP